MMRKALLLLLAISTSLGIEAQETKGNVVEVEITDIDNNDGKMMIGLYDSEENWLKKTTMSKMGQIKNKKSSAVFENVPDGVYAISLYHDENDNGELDMNFLGIPKEDTGSSNNAPARFGPPQWEDAKFEIKGKSIKQTIQL